MLRLKEAAVLSAGSSQFAYNIVPGHYRNT